MARNHNLDASTHTFGYSRGGRFRPPVCLGLERRLQHPLWYTPHLRSTMISSCLARAVRISSISRTR